MSRYIGMATAEAFVRELELPATQQPITKEPEPRKEDDSQKRFRVDLIFHNLEYGQQMEESLKMKEGVLKVSGRQRTRHNYQVTVRANGSFLESVLQNFIETVRHEHFVLVCVSDESKVETELQRNPK